jgi:uncharacterized protein YciI
VSGYHAQTAAQRPPVPPDPQTAAARPAALPEIYGDEQQNSYSADAALAIGLSATDFASWCCPVLLGSHDLGRPGLRWHALPRARILSAMADYYLVEQAKGPAWDHSRARREQARWDQHAMFMDTLADEGFIFLCGPIGEGNGDDALLIIDADDEETVRALLAADPWSGEILTIESIRPRSVWLRGSQQAR